MLHNVVYNAYYEIITCKFKVYHDSVFNKIMICNNTLLLNVAAVYDNFDSPISGCMCVCTSQHILIANDEKNPLYI